MHHVCVCVCVCGGGGAVTPTHAFLYETTQEGNHTPNSNYHPALLSFLPQLLTPQPVPALLPLVHWWKTDSYLSLLEAAMYAQLQWQCTDEKLLPVMSGGCNGSTPAVVETKGQLAWSCCVECVRSWLTKNSGILVLGQPLQQHVRPCSSQQRQWWRSLEFAVGWLHAGDKVSNQGTTSTAGSRAKDAALRQLFQS